MTSLTERVGRRIARQFGYQLQPLDTHDQMLEQLAATRDMVAALDSEAGEFARYCLPLLARSRSQLLQDLFALRESGGKRGGFFVEFGATDGMTISNSYMLESDYDWRASSQSRRVHGTPALNANRRCIIDHRCVTDRSGATVTFNEAPWLEVSTIDSFSGGDHHARSRRGGTHCQVETVSLVDLLRQHDAPAEFDYLSIDTEGSELMILQGFDLAAFRPHVITVEHNFTDARDALHDLLTSQGYRRKLAAFTRFDDWYVRT